MNIQTITVRRNELRVSLSYLNSLIEAAERTRDEDRTTVESTMFKCVRLSREHVSLAVISLNEALAAHADGPVGGPAVADAAPAKSSEDACRKNYNNRYHMVKADLGFDAYQRIWNDAVKYGLESAPGATHHNFRTHAASWRNALEKMVATTKPGPDPDQDDHAYWVHELNAYDEAFATITGHRPKPVTGLSSIRGWKPDSIIIDDIANKVHTIELFEWQVPFAARHSIQLVSSKGGVSPLVPIPEGVETIAVTVGKLSDDELARRIAAATLSKTECTNSDKFNCKYCGETAGCTAMNSTADATPAHDLYTDADKDRPQVICDSNGQVALSMCKRCGKGESQLTEPCISARPGPFTTTPSGKLIDLGMPLEIKINELNNGQRWDATTNHSAQIFVRYTPAEALEAALIDSFMARGKVRK